MVELIASMANAGIDNAFSVANTVLNQRNFEKERQRDQANIDRDFEYMKQMHELTRAREDTAYQRKVSDMTAAGLHKTLAAGGSPSATSMPTGLGPSGNSVSPPHLDASGGSISDYLQAKQLIMQKEMNDAQIGLINAQTKESEARTLNVGRQTQNIDFLETLQGKQYKNDLVNTAIRDAQQQTYDKSVENIRINNEAVNELANKVFGENRRMNNWQQIIETISFQYRSLELALEERGVAVQERRQVMDEYIQSSAQRLANDVFREQKRMNRSDERFRNRVQGFNEKHMIFNDINNGLRTIIYGMRGGSEPRTPRPGGE